MATISSGNEQRRQVGEGHLYLYCWRIVIILWLTLGCRTACGILVQGGTFRLMWKEDLSPKKGALR